MYELNCIKCSNKYQSEDEDPYYCVPCNELRKAIAKDVDMKLQSRPSKRKAVSLLQEYDASPKVRGFVITKL